MHCPLCLNTKAISEYHSDKKRDYLHCGECDLVFVSPEYLPLPQREKQEYDLHENDFEDEGYRKFLGKVLTPLSQFISQRGKSRLNGLDFGCGPAPVLAHMLTEEGVDMSVFDPFFANNTEVLSHRYDLITCTEAIEHFHTPHKEWSLFNRMLKDGGVIAIMTKRHLDKARFANWHYKNDITHVCFFSEATFRYLANKENYDVSFPTNDVVLLKKV